MTDDEVRGALEHALNWLEDLKPRANHAQQVVVQLCIDRGRAALAHEPVPFPLDTGAAALQVDLPPAVLTEIETLVDESEAEPVTLTHEQLVAGFICPRCALVSHNPTDIVEGYCANCKDWTRGPG